MNFKLDENLPADAALLLTQAGHNVETIYREGLQGRPDSEIARHCQRENRILVTLDRGFGDTRRYPPSDYPGFVVLRPRRQDRNQVLQLLDRVIPLLLQEQLEGHLWIVEETRLRIRPVEPTETL